MIQFILKLEKSLWVEETRYNKEYLDKILHKEFMEFGKSGKVFSKQDILNDTEGEINAVFPFENFQVKTLDSNTFLVTYQVKTKQNDIVVYTNRSSIWVGENRNIQMIFHQGTIFNK